MHVIHKITLTSMRLNKRRTLVTLVGVILSVSMICALTTLVQSFQDLFIRNTIRLSGSYELEYYDVPKDKADVIIKDENTKECLISYSDSVVKLSNKDSEKNAYAAVNVYDMNHLSLNGLTLIKGKLPTQKDEILLSKQMAKEKESIYNIGDTITLPIGYYANKEGKRDYSQFQKDFDTTKFIQTGTRTFHITGIVNDDTIINNNYDIYLPLQGNKGNKDTKYIISVITNSYRNTIYEEAEQLLSKHKLEGVTINLHQDLLTFYGSDKGLYHGQVIILCMIMGFIIFIASFALIYNAFSISLAQRSKYLGILTSIGTTKRQKRNSVLFEALVVSCIGIPIGMLAGYVGVAITFACVQPILHTALKAPLSIHMIITWQSVLITIVSSICIIFFSAWIPAKRASKISGITAIRQTKEIKVSGHDVKTSMLTRKLFGYEAELGLKNRKRNKHQYRTIICSLTISVILFMSSLSFASFIKTAVQMGGVKGTADIIVNMDYASTKKLQTKVEHILALPNIESYMYSNRVRVRDEEHVLRYTEEMSTYLKQYYSSNKNDDRISIDVIALDDKSFQAYAKNIGVNTVQFETGTHVILLNSGQMTLTANNTREVRQIEPVNDNLLLRITKENGVESTQPITIASSTTIQPDALTQIEDIAEDRIRVITNEKTFLKIVNEFPDDGELFITTNLQLKSSDANQLESDILQLDDGYLRVDNRHADREVANSITIFTSIFLYGFFVLVILICSVNVYNTLSTGLILRKHEFAMIKSIGITKQKFYKMIIYECLCYAGIGLFYGFTISLCIHYWMYRTMMGIQTIEYTLYHFPLKNIGSIACIVIGILLMSAWLTMKKMEKESIVDTIHNENI